MKRRGVWVALTAVVAGSALLFSAGCGSSGSSSSGGGGASAGAIPAHQNGGTIKVALSGNVDYMDPALAYYQSTWQILYSTCVKLTDYKDVTGDAGRVIYPEAASAMPDISSDGLTYTYTVPPGRFKFNTGEPVTAQSFQHALERDLNPNQASYFGSVFLAPVIKGASDFKGKPGEHVSGIQVQGDKLTITLVKPDAGLLSKLTTPFACAVSKDMPIDDKGVHTRPWPARTTSRRTRRTARSCSRRTPTGRTRPASSGPPTSMRSTTPRSPRTPTRARCRSRTASSTTRRTRSARPSSSS